MMKTDAQLPNNVMVELENVHQLKPLKLAPIITIVRNQTVLKRNVTSLIVKANIVAALKRCAPKDMQEIMITINGGKVTLKGLVGSWPQWDRVSNLVWNTPSVTDVRDNISVAN